MASVKEDIRQSIIKGLGEEEVRKLTQKAVDEGYEPIQILNEGLIAGIDAVGIMWKEGELFLPEVLLSAKVMRAGMNVIRELLAKSGAKSRSKVVIGTVKGDVHDIGKSLVGMMMEAFGFEVYDLGVDVPVEKFMESAKTKGAQMVCMSSLLTTTMPEMENNIRTIKQAGLKVKTMVGGAPVTQEYADRIGADGYAPDAISAVDKAKELMGR